MALHFFLSSLLLLFTVPFATPTLFQGIPEFKYPSIIQPASEFSSLPSTSSTSLGGSNYGGKSAYDYIIVGGGTAGIPLAATLSQKFRVLLLERGGVPYDNFNVSLMNNFHVSLADTSPSSASQQFTSTDGVINARAKVLGGGTCINAGFYSRASSSFVKAARWSPNLVQESYEWVEDQIVHKPKVTPWQEAVMNALVEAGVSPFNGVTYDHNYGTKFSGSIFDHDGLRHTAVELLTSANSDNLNIFIHATVHRIAFDKQGERPKATGVIFKDEHGKQHQAFLSERKESEIIVSSGTIGSPQLLLLSGIGPKEDLDKMSIPVVLDNKFVGEGTQDNPLNTIFIPFKKDIPQTLLQVVGISRLGSYIETSSGFGQSTNSIKRHHGLLSAEIGQLSTIPPKQRTSEAIQAFKNWKLDLPYEAFRGGFILEKVSKPVSRGNLKLINTNIENNPKVTFNYFKHPKDLRTCVRSIQLIEKIVQSKHLKDYIDSDKATVDKLLAMSVKANVNLIPKHTNDTKSLEQFCKDTVITMWHYHGGCQVGKVVGPDYRVLGIDGLRVVDGSTFNDSPGTNPQATVMMLGRYVGMNILKERQS